MFGKPVEAVIFDMDGLLIDSEAVYIAAMQEAARNLGLEMSIAFCHSMIGIPRRECNVMIQGLYGADFDQPVAFGRAEARRFRIEDDLTHRRRFSCPALPPRYAESRALARE